MGLSTNCDASVALLYDFKSETVGKHNSVYPLFFGKDCHAEG